MSVGALAVLALGTAALFDLGPFAPSEPDGLEIQDRSGDCREAGLDTGERCDAGADVETILISESGEDTLVVELHLDSAPSINPSLAWTAEFYVDAVNAYTDGGIICRLSNVDEAGRSRPEVVSRPLDPNRIPRVPTDERACRGQLDGSVARFMVDVTGQPTDTQIRLIGLVRVERPDDPDDLGSEDDFLVQASLAGLRA